MSVDFSPPSPELARRILATASYDQRLRVGRLTPPVGLLASHVRSLHELYLHLEPDGRSLPGINVGGAAAWFESTIGDGELAARTREIDGAAATYVEKCQRLFELVAARIAQAREAVGDASAGGGSSLPREAGPPAQGGDE